MKTCKNTKNVQENMPEHHLRTETVPEEKDKNYLPYNCKLFWGGSVDQMASQSTQHLEILKHSAGDKNQFR